MPNVSVVDWQATDERGKFVGSVALAAGTTDIALQTGSLFRGEIAIVPRWVLVDNLANNANVPVSFGPFSYTVPRFQREVFKIPVPLATFRAVVSTGTVVVTFAEERDSLIAGADQFAIQQAANQFVSYEWQTLTVGRAQNANDQNTNLELANAADQSYSLLGIGANSIPDGWYNPAIANTGVGRWSLVPNGADQINSLWTSANPLRLSTGDTIALWCDGSQWRASGAISVLSGQLTVATGLTTFAHGLGTTPTPEQCEAFLECTTANVGYTVGQMVKMPANSDNTSRIGMCSLSADATNIYLYVNTASPDITNATTFARTVITAASWRYRIRVRLTL